VIHAKGGESISPKRKDRTTTNFQNFKSLEMMNLSINILLFSKGGESSIFKIGILKPSWTLRGGFYWGGVLFSQRKSIWKRERKFEIMRMLLKILFIYLWQFAKELWNKFTKEFAKTKHVVQAWSKNVKNIKKQSMHISWEFILAQF
jgi:hypothetical protein